MPNTEAHRPPARILALDDNPDNLHLLTSILSERGYAVRPTTDAELALASAQANPPDLILLDILLPGTDGYIVCEALKSDKRTRHVPVIFISALSEPFDKVRAFEVGAVDYITKPFYAEEVLARVATHVALQFAQRELNEQNARLQREIAERQRAEQALRASQALLRGLLEHSPASIGVQDLQGRYVAVNRALLRSRGLTDERQILGKTLADFPAIRGSGRSG